MAELEHVMRTTFAAREFTDDPVPDEDLVAILDLARFAPSGGNRQGWTVIAVRDPDTKAQVVRHGAAALRLYVAQRAAGENPWNTIDPSSIDPASIDHDDDAAIDWYLAIAEAPVLLVIGVDLKVVASVDRDLDRVGVASGGSIYPFVQNLLLAARARGYAGTLTTFFSAEESQVQQVLGLPSHIALAALIPLGRPRRELTKLTRKPVSDFARLERYDGPPLGA
jgi:nitroreductase